MLKPPIFLIGNVRSGTSMMHDLFDLRDDVKSWSEPRTLWAYADPARRHDRFDASDATPRVCRYIRKRFAQHQRRHGDRRVMEKTPSNVMRIPYVRTIFPESKLLYILRDPLANLSSTSVSWNAKPINRRRLLSRLGETPKSQLHYYIPHYLTDLYRIKVLKQKRVSIWGVRYEGVYDDLQRMTTEEVIAHQWVKCSQQADADLAQIDPDLVMRIRYEGFVTNPLPIFQQICKHFDLPMTEALARTVTDRVDPHRRDKWRSLPQDVLARCLPILAPEMTRQEYDIPDDLRGLVQPNTRDMQASPD